MFGYGPNYRMLYPLDKQPHHPDDYVANKFMEYGPSHRKRIMRKWAGRCVSELSENFEMGDMDLGVDMGELGGILSGVQEISEAAGNMAIETGITVDDVQDAANKAKFAAEKAQEFKNDVDALELDKAKKNGLVAPGTASDEPKPKKAFCDCETEIVKLPQKMDVYFTSEGRPDAWKEYTPEQKFSTTTWMITELILTEKAET